MMGVTGIDGRGRKTSRPYAGSTPATSTRADAGANGNCVGGVSPCVVLLRLLSVGLLRSAECPRGVRFPNRSLRGTTTPQQPNTGALALLLFQLAHPTTEEERRML